MILYRMGEKAFFMFGFAKSKAANFGVDDLAEFKRAAKYVLELSNAQLAMLLERGDFVEVRAK